MEKMKQSEKTKRIERLKQNKTYIILTCVITLLPMIIGILLWSKLPDRMATHFGADNNPNGWSGKGFAVFGLPLFCLAIHLLCTFATLADPKHQGIPEKVYKLMLLITPLASLFCGVAIYGYILYPQMDIGIIAKIFLGLVLVSTGNYLPKCRQNYTVGIKLPWTLSDEENWDHTHRLAGRIWVLCGVFFIINAFLNIGGAAIFFLVFAVIILVPVGYSLIYYIRHSK